MNLLDKIYLIDMEPNLVEHWDKRFSDVPIVKPLMCDYFDYPADCMVSPANSFGIMDGGIDRAITYELGELVQTRLQAEIIQEYHGELPVGSAIIVSTNNDKWPNLISAPTMRLPENISETINAYYAFRAILLTIKKFNESDISQKIRSLVCCGLGTGIGGLAQEMCAIQMRAAFDSLQAEPKILSPKEIYKSQKLLQTKHASA